MMNVISTARFIDIICISRDVLVNIIVLVYVLLLVVVIFIYKSYDYDISQYENYAKFNIISEMNEVPL